MDYLKKHKQWLNSSIIDNNNKEELLLIQNNEDEINNRFFKELSFGTGGLRAIIGAGTNRMNIYTVRKATQGLANYIESKGSVVIAYDSRHYSEIFALEAALVLTANNIKVFLFDSLRPTPELSYAIRYLNTTAGIVITASHNPPNYNGYKVYGADGGQITLNSAKAISTEINKLDIFNDIKTMQKEEALNKNLLTYVGEEIDKSYLSKIATLFCKRNMIRKPHSLNIVYTPLHGSGLMLIEKTLAMLKYSNLHLVKSQITPDGDFPTVKSPNPEDKNAFIEGIKLAKKTDSDIILATDPDCDRVGVFVKSTKGNYHSLTGNQIGALITQYLCSQKENIASKDVIIKTIATSELGANIAKAYGATTIDTLTGFKFIGEKIKEFEESGEYNFLFGYEESYGYLAGTFTRDKDAVIATGLIVEMAAYYMDKGMTLLDAIEKIYSQYGYYTDLLTSYTYKGFNGKKEMDGIIEKFRNDDELLNSFEDIKYIEDYKTHERKYVDTKKTEILLLPKSNVIKIYFNDTSWIVIRPSGTEPKLKIYFSTIGSSKNISSDKLEKLKNAIHLFIGQ